MIPTDDVQRARAMGYYSMQPAGTGSEPLSREGRIKELKAEGYRIVKLRETYMAPLRERGTGKRFHTIEEEL